MFKRQAHFIISGEWADEDKLMDVVLENGANDLEVEDGIAEVWADPEYFEDLLKVFEEKGIPTDTAEVVRKAEMVTEITDVAIARQVMRMIDRLEELDDVQNVTSNYELSDAVAEELENEE
jgi:transcriptional/translational regulatory protein YebC/TACO1